MLTFIHPKTMTKEQMGYLVRAVSSDTNGDIDRVLALLDIGNIHALWWETDVSKMLCVAQVHINFDHSRDMFISLLAGDGPLKEVEKILPELKRVAYDYMRCKAVVAFMNPDLYEILAESGGGANVKYLVLEYPVGEGDSGYTDGNSTEII